MTLEFSVGKMYKTRDGRKAQIFMLDNGMRHMIGAILENGVWMHSLWFTTGMWSRNNYMYDSDLVSEWPNLESDFSKVTVDSVDYYDANVACTHQEALDLAAKHGLRVLESWEMHKLWIESEDFRKSLESRWYWRWYWCASVYSGIRSYAWHFNGSGGGVSVNSRSGSYGVRCVAKEALEAKK